MFTVLVTGASGLIGTQLIDYLLNCQSGEQYRIIALSRNLHLSTQDNLIWIQHFSELEYLLAEHDFSLDYVVNLAGESIAQKRWTDARKRQLIQSRVETTQQLFECLQQLNIHPKCIVSGSAIGLYGIDETEQWLNECDENMPSQSIFMSELCYLWESEALKYQYNTKIIRLGVVFSKRGGALTQMLLPIKLNLIGRIGTGQQPMTWVHIDDVIQAILFLFNHQTRQTIFNVVAPDHISQMQFVQVASHVLKRRPLLFFPSFAMKMLMGERAQLVLNGQYVQPKALLAEGFNFQYTNLDDALSNQLV